MNNISFKQRVCQSIIDQSKIYQKIFVDRQYLICSKCFKNRKYYILVANKDNYLHLVGVHTNLTPSDFFEKCFLLIYNRVVDKMKVVYPFYESVIIKKPKKVNV